MAAPSGGGGGGGPVGFTGSVASTGQGLSYIEDRVYAYSGAIPCSNSAKTLLDFTTQQGTVIAKIKFAVATPATENDAMRVQFQLNSTIVYQSILYSGIGGYDYVSNRETVKVVIPPNSHFQVFGENITDASSREIAVIIAGKVQ